MTFEPKLSAESGGRGGPGTPEGSSFCLEYLSPIFVLIAGPSFQGQGHKGGLECCSKGKSDCARTGLSIVAANFGFSRRHRGSERVVVT